MIRFRPVSDIARHSVGDVFPEVVLVNSHDGSSSYQLSGSKARIAETLNDAGRRDVLITIRSRLVRTIGKYRRGELAQAIVRQESRGVIGNGTDREVVRETHWGSSNDLTISGGIREAIRVDLNSTRPEHCSNIGYRVKSKVTKIFTGWKLRKDAQ